MNLHFAKVQFEAQVSLDYPGGDPQLTETVFGWSRHTVAKGLKERRTGQIIPDAPRTYKPKTEDAQPQLAQDIKETDASFENVHRINAESDAREDSLRKRSRGAQAVAGTRRVPSTERVKNIADGTRRVPATF